jgi:hypothetical protein
MKLLSITFIFVLAMNCSRCQTQYYDQNKNQDMEEIVSIQQAGYLLTGLGASAIVYAAAKSSTVKNPTAWYIGGSALITGGICLIIFGKKEKEPKYWKGMQGYSPHQNFGIVSERKPSFSSQTMQLETK